MKSAYSALSDDSGRAVTVSSEYRAGTGKGLNVRVMKWFGNQWLLPPVLLLFFAPELRYAGTPPRFYLTKRDARYLTGSDGCFLLIVLVAVRSRLFIDYQQAGKSAQ